MRLRGHETVLLVEDNAAVRTVVRRILDQHGYVVLEASDGERALATARKQEKIDLLLTDVVMPEMSGRELSAQFRALFPNAKVLYMSGHADDSMLPQMLGEDEPYLEKPFTVELLAGKLREVLDAS